jgi:hypothetical protein
MHSLDHVREKPKSEFQIEQVQGEETNTELDQGKPRCITPQSLTFILNHYLYVKVDCTLGL